MVPKVESYQLQPFNYENDHKIMAFMPVRHGLVDVLEDEPVIHLVMSPQCAGADIRNLIRKFGH